MTQANNDELAGLTTRELQQRYEQVHGIATTSRSRGYLLRQIRAGLSQAKETLETSAPPSEAAPGVPGQQIAPAAGGTEADTNTPSEVPSTNEASAAPATEMIAAPKEQPRRTRKHTVAPGVRDPRLPAAGTVMTREFGGRAHHVTVGEEDFEYEGKRWTSLSALAKHIAGTTWNGLLFFKLIPYVRRTKAAA